MSKKFRRHPDLKRLEGGWRKPKTRTNKVRRKLKGKKPMPLIGYGSPRERKNLHPTGMQEIIVSSPKDVEKIDKSVCIRIAKSVGKKKRLEIINEAKKKGIKVLNPRVEVKKNDSSVKKK